MTTTKNTIQDILSEATIENNIVKLNCGELDRNLYTKVNDVLVRLWGKWNRSKGGHVFTYNPTAAIQAYVDTGILPAKNELSYFPTPDKLIDEILEYVEVDYCGIIRTVLEPSAGQGAIVDRIKEEYPEAAIDCVELSKLHATVLESKGYEVTKKDFLKYKTKKKYDLIIMNPPFNTPGNKNCYIEHIQHAYDLLEDWGILYAIASLGWVTRNDKKHKEFREWLSLRVNEIVTFDRGEFKSSGTMIGTCMFAFSNKKNLNSRELTVRNFGFFYEGDYGYEHYRHNEENKKLTPEAYFDKCFGEALDPKLTLDIMAWDFREDCIEACKEWDLEYKI